MFRHKVVPYKAHFVADLRRPPEESSGGTIATTPSARWPTSSWSVAISRANCSTNGSLSDHLIARHRLSGIKAFSRAAFSMQLAVPGVVMLRASQPARPSARISGMCRATSFTVIWPRQTRPVTT